MVADAWGAAFLGSAEPWKLSFQNPAGLGRGLGQRRDSGSGLWGQLGLRLLTGAPVARLRFAAAGADAPQLLGGLIKEEVGVVGHGCSFARPFIPWLGPKGKPSAPLYDAFLPRVFKEMGPEPSRDAVRPITLRGNNAERSARGSLVKHRSNDLRQKTRGKYAPRLRRTTGRFGAAGNYNRGALRDSFRWRRDLTKQRRGFIWQQLSDITAFAEPNQKLCYEAGIA